MFPFRRNKKIQAYLHPDEVFLDSHNLPSFNTQQFEGRIERPLSKKVFLFLGAAFLLVGLGYLWQVGYLSVAKGAELAERSVNNSLRHRPIFADRGVIVDRNNVELVWNNPGRTYTPKEGFAHVLGYIGYPTEKELAQEAENYFPKEYIGRSGVESYYDQVLRGRPGIQIEEVDVRGKVQSDHVLQTPISGKTVTLSIDSRIQETLYQKMKELAIDRGFAGGAGVIMDVKTGEIIALTSYPEYSPQILVDGNDRSTIQKYFSDVKHPLLNRAVAGLYVPGSIIKPYVALGALDQGIISPEKQIQSTGSISIPNPYFPDKPTVFRDWKAHGWVDMRKALAVSSDVYFYEVGGGYPGQKGIGIANIDKYVGMFGIGKKTGIDLGGEIDGVIPTPEWKAKNFNGEPWRIGDTYHTAIGQYGFQVTPLQMVRAVAGIATNGVQVTPTITVPQSAAVPTTKVALPLEDFTVVKEGMRQAVVSGITGVLKVPYVEIASKSGTAELGVSKEKVNSWITGFFPYDHPRYAFALMMEKGGRENLVGAAYAFRQTLDWMSIYTPEYFK